MSSSSSNPNVIFSQFQDLFGAALNQYNQKTGNDLVTDPLFARLLPCDTSDAVLHILKEQTHAFNQYWNGDWKIQVMRRLKPIVDILLGLSTSGVFGEGIGLVRLTKSMYPLWTSTFTLQRVPPAKAIFAGVGLLLAVCTFFALTCIVALVIKILKAAKGVSTSYDALIELFECFDHCLGRLRVLTGIPSAVKEIFVKIMVLLLDVLALATQQIKQGRFSELVLSNTYSLYLA